MPSVNDIYLFLEKLAPKSMKMDFDNVGLLAGFTNREVTKILITLDITDEVIREAIDKKAELIVSHHPMFFDLKSVTDGDRTGRKLVTLLNNSISAICMHTNLDCAKSGVNDALAKTLGLKDIELLTVDGTLSSGEAYSYGRIGEISEAMTMNKFLTLVKDALKVNGLRYHDACVPVKRVAVVGGSGGSDLPKALAGKCDTFITADIKYDTFLLAKEEGINLIDADHFCTENVICPVLKSWLSVKFKNVDSEISSIHKQTAQFF